MARHAHQNAETSLYGLMSEEWFRKNNDLTAAEAEAVSRLRDLREQFARVNGETCRATPIGTGVTAYPFRDNGDGTCSLEMGRPRDLNGVRCSLPTGHDGEHEGNLGPWHWSDE